MTDLQPIGKLKYVIFMQAVMNNPYWDLQFLQLPLPQKYDIYQEISV